MKFRVYLALACIVSSFASFDGEAPVSHDEDVKETISAEGDLMNSSLVGTDVTELFSPRRRASFSSPRRRAATFSPRRRAMVVSPRRRAMPVVSPRRRAMPVVSPRRRATPVVSPPRRRATPVVSPPRRRATPVVSPPRRRAMPVVSPRRRSVEPAVSPRRRSVEPAVSPRRRSVVPAVSPRRRLVPSGGGSFVSPRRRAVPIVYPRRRTMIANLRRRSSDWHVNNYYPRRRYAQSSISQHGFLTGVTVGSTIGMGGSMYYYHEYGWHDNMGVWHPPGYYSSSGTYYNDPAYFGYTPQPGMPGYGMHYNPPGYRPNGGSNTGGGVTLLVLLVLIIVCCWCCGCCPKSSGGDSGQGQGQASEPLLNSDAGQRPSSCPVNDDDATGWLGAARREYVERQQGALGNWMDEVGMNDRDQTALNPYEERIRNAGGGAEGEIRRIGDEWGIRFD